MEACSEWTSHLSRVRIFLLSACQLSAAQRPAQSGTKSEAMLVYTAPLSRSSPQRYVAARQTSTSLPPPGGASPKCRAFRFATSAWGPICRCQKNRAGFYGLSAFQFEGLSLKTWHDGSFDAVRCRLSRRVSLNSWVSDGDELAPIEVFGT